MPALLLSPQPPSVDSTVEVQEGENYWHILQVIYTVTLLTPYVVGAVWTLRRIYDGPDNLFIHVWDVYSYRYMRRNTSLVNYGEGDELQVDPPFKLMAWKLPGSLGLLF